MVSNIAVNVLGGGAEMQGRTDNVCSDIHRSPTTFPVDNLGVFFNPPPISVGNVSSHEENMTEPSTNEFATQNTPEDITTE